MNLNKNISPEGGFLMGELVVFAAGEIYNQDNIWDVLTEEDVYPEQRVIMPLDIKMTWAENRANHMKQIRQCDIKIGRSSYSGRNDSSLIWTVVCSRKKLNWLIVKTGATIY